MEDIYERQNGKPDTPHRHDYYTVIFTKSAKGKHVIDFNTYELSDQQAHFVGPGQVHQIIEDHASNGYGLFFSNQFLIENNIPTTFIENLNLFNDFGESPPLKLDADSCERIFTFLEEVYQINQTEDLYKVEASGAYLKLILIQCNYACPKPKEQFHATEPLLPNFKRLIELNFKKWHSTKNYADHLHISADHLNRVIKSQTGKTAKEHIQSRIIVAAKRMLYFTDLTNKEIGYELGFSEPGNFSAFFKNCVGVSPSIFKSKH
jgi:AraC-like DNA-binding protein